MPALGRSLRKCSKEAAEMVIRKVQMFKSLYSIVFFTSLILLAAPISSSAAASEEADDLRVVSDLEIADLTDSLQAHELFRLAWPSKEEITRNTCEVPQAIRDKCVADLRASLNSDIIPSDIAQHLIPMRRWGEPTKDYVTRGYSDVFIARFENANLVLQLMESAYSTVVIVRIRNANPIEADFEARKRFVQRMARAILAETVLVSHMDSIRLSHKRSNDKLLRGSWVPDSNIVGDRTDGLMTVRTGAEVTAKKVEYETNGRYVLFELIKSPMGSRAFGDPYRDRFSPSEDTEARRLMEQKRQMELLTSKLNLARETNSIQVLKDLAQLDDRRLRAIREGAMKALAGTLQGRLALVDLLAQSERIPNVASLLAEKAEMGELQGTLVINKLISILDETTPDQACLRYETARILGKAQDRRAVDALVSAYREEANSETREGIVQALGVIKDPSALVFLKEAAEKDSAAQVRLYAKMAICNIEGTDYEDVRLREEIEK